MHDAAASLPVRGDILQNAGQIPVMLVLRVRGNMRVRAHLERQQRTLRLIVFHNHPPRLVNRAINVLCC
ncbi:hypothetical protein D3C84_1208150 [compost metagenome]